jgi:hypothetical protein
MKKFILLFLFTISLFAKENSMEISIKQNGKTIIFKLNDSVASKELYNQLPLSVKVENFSTNEKIFYPPKKLNIDNTPLENAKNGSLSYYAPWGDVVMFYDDFGSASGLYELGFVVSGVEHIESLSGTIEINKR